LRTQQVILAESGVANTIDPLGGSYYVEWLTNKLEQEALDYIARIDEQGGMVSAIEKGYPQREIAASSYRFQRQLENRERLMVGVNQNLQEDASHIPTLRIDGEVQRVQCANLAKVKASRDGEKLHATLSAVRKAARDGSNLMPPIIESAKAYATEQEICDILREELGTYTDPAEF
jgi:methylmalonyl-CoA mutase N-terminal domain/subunit